MALFNRAWPTDNYSSILHVSEISPFYEIGFVTLRLDYMHGNIILVGAPKSVTNKLQRVLNAAARIVTGTRKYDQGLS